ncbi:DUF2793 domain-containing protein [Jannaschia sp. CCS1]|uniref:DUF2793 domain-containing protein n=1 Tax=Jannaschia sp. (strain CCS1) TaxID=290400 RepID=UPI000053C176|nr:DUF2793 domain-containing protein [Jannaschia sp. CCS1]ABD54564.1 hypothetical protein Jann_1647 [Jannaschia sp. CCS1]
MTDTPELGLPLLAPAQAQKHVTVNEALVRLDGLAQLRLQSVTETTPPAALDGFAYGVPTGAVDAWAGQEGSIAIASGGGWDFVSAQRGWRAIVLDAGSLAIFDGTGWRVGAQTLTPGGASVGLTSTEVDVALTAGTSVTTADLFPERSIAYGITGRVVSAITGTVTTWDIGVAGDLQRYGSGLGTSLNSWVSGPGVPQVYWSPTALEITAQGGDFAGGTIRLVAHYATLSLPDPV